MEAKLKEYRALRRRKELIEHAKDKISKTKEKVANFFITKIFKDMAVRKKDEEVVLLEEEEEEIVTQISPEKSIQDLDVTSEVSEEESLPEEPWTKIAIKWSIYTIIWLSLYIFFLQIEFGAVYFVISVLICIYLNTGTRPKKRGEASAYSVFNPNCESIEGTLKAEQLQRQMLYGPVSLF